MSPDEMEALQFPIGRCTPKTDFGGDGMRHAIDEIAAAPEELQTKAHLSGDRTGDARRDGPALRLARQAPRRTHYVAAGPEGMDVAGVDPR